MHRREWQTRLIIFFAFLTILLVALVGVTERKSRRTLVPGAGRLQPDWLALPTVLPRTPTTFEQDYTLQPPALGEGSMPVLPGAETPSIPTLPPPSTAVVITPPFWAGKAGTVSGDCYAADNAVITEWQLPWGKCWTDTTDVGVVSSVSLNPAAEGGVWLIRALQERKDLGRNWIERQFVPYGQCPHADKWEWVADGYAKAGILSDGTPVYSVQGENVIHVGNRKLPVAGNSFYITCLEYACALAGRFNNQGYLFVYPDRLYPFFWEGTLFVPLEIAREGTEWIVRGPTLIGQTFFTHEYRLRGEEIVKTYTVEGLEWEHH